MNQILAKSEAWPEGPHGPGVLEAEVGSSRGLSDFLGFRVTV